MRLLVLALLLAASCRSSAYAQTDTERQSFLHRHPWLSAAGVGALTGGVGGVLLGGTLLHGAAVGAGTHTGFHYLHEKYDRWKQRHQSHAGY